MRQGRLVCGLSINTSVGLSEVLDFFTVSMTFCLSPSVCTQHYIIYKIGTNKLNLVIIFHRNTLSRTKE